MVASASRTREGRLLGEGDPSGFLGICAPDVVYFDPFLDVRLDPAGVRTPSRPDTG